MRYTIERIKQENAAKGGNFFEKGAMRFFRSRVSGKVFQGPAGIFFVTSEQFDAKSVRKFTVRQFLPYSGGVQTVGEFMQHRTLQSAKNAAAVAAVEGVTVSTTGE